MTGEPSWGLSKTAARLSLFFFPVVPRHHLERSGSSFIKVSRARICSRSQSSDLEVIYGNVNA